MELQLLKLAAFLRPIFFIEVNAENLFELAAILMFVILSAAFLVKAAVEKDVSVSAIDIWILLFSIWCVAVYVTYPDKASFREAAKLIIPLWTYVVAKNIVRSQQDYLAVLRFLILGFVPPVVLSLIFIHTGGGVEVIDYWTGIARWRGAYAGSHSLGHNMGFVVIAVTIYWTIGRIGSISARRGTPPGVGMGMKAGHALLVTAALYCLYQSQVRTAVLGLFLFLAIFLLNINRRLLIAIVALVAVGVTAALPVLIPRFFHDVVMVEKGRWSAEEIGSGRPRIWRNNIDLFAEMPIDRQLAGVGIGNKIGIGGTEGISDSHNDLLDVVIQTGVVGFLLFLGIQFLFLKKILALKREERAAFLALFVAVMVMNVVSNSYVTRFGLAQMYYLVLSYIEIRRRTERVDARLPVTGLASGAGR